MKNASNVTPAVLAAALAALALAVAAGAPAASGRQQEEASPPSYPHEGHFVLGRRTTEGRSESVFKLSDGDVIRVQRRPTRWRPLRTEGELPPLLIRFILDTAPDVTWWKGITVYQHELPSAPHRPRGRWVKLGQLSLEGSTGNTSSLDIHVSQLRGGVALVFEKAKALGAHTPMHGMLLTEADGHLAGETIRFVWEKDR